MVGNLIHRKTDNTIIKKRQTMVGNIIHRKTDNTIIKKTNNGRQHHTQKNRQYNYKKDKQWLATAYTEKQTIQL
jgi:hypothetical protein